MIAMNRELSVETQGMAPEELVGTVSRLLLDAGRSLGTDLFAAKKLIDQASALLDWRHEACPSAVEVDPGRAQALTPWQVKRLVAFVTFNLSSRIKNADMSAAVGLSSSYFVVAFKKSFGLTPCAYVLQRRVQRAKELILSTDESLAQIALICGFHDQAGLSRLFKREAGLAPMQWRRSRGECAAALRAGFVDLRSSTAQPAALAV